MRGLWILAGALALAAGACGSEETGGGSTAVSTKGFDKGCMADSDCVAVYEGNACNACRCENAAIAKAALKEYERELTFAEDRCTNVPACAADCASPVVACDQGACIVTF